MIRITLKGSKTTLKKIKAYLLQHKITWDAVSIRADGTVSADLIIPKIEKLAERGVIQSLNYIFEGEE